MFRTTIKCRKCDKDKLPPFVPPDVFMAVCPAEGTIYSDCPHCGHGIVVGEDGILMTKDEYATQVSAKEKEELEESACKGRPTFPSYAQRMEELCSTPGWEALPIPQLQQKA